MHNILTAVEKINHKDGDQSSRLENESMIDRGQSSKMSNALGRSFRMTLASKITEKRFTGAFKKTN